MVKVPNFWSFGNKDGQKGNEAAKDESEESKDPIKRTQPERADDVWLSLDFGDTNTCAAVWDQSLKHSLVEMVLIDETSKNTQLATVASYKSLNSTGHHCQHTLEPGRRAQIMDELVRQIGQQKAEQEHCAIGIKGDITVRQRWDVQQLVTA